MLGRESRGFKDVSCRGKRRVIKTEPVPPGLLRAPHRGRHPAPPPVSPSCCLVGGASGWVGHRDSRRGGTGGRDGRGIAMGGAL